MRAERTASGHERARGGFPRRHVRDSSGGGAHLVEEVLESSGSRHGACVDMGPWTRALLEWMGSRHELVDLSSSGAELARAGGRCKVCPTRTGRKELKAGWISN